MPSEREIDNYIDSMEEKNQIYIEEELNYASKCHSLEEQLGCPLEVVFKALQNGVWVFLKLRESREKESKMYETIKHLEVKLMNHNRLFILDDSKLFLLPKDYKKTWWLKEDKSE